MRPLRGLQETRVATREESGVLGFPSRRGLTPRGLQEGPAALGLSGQQDTGPCPGCPLQPQALSCQAQLYVPQILQGNG